MSAYHGHGHPSNPNTTTHAVGNFPRLPQVTQPPNQFPPTRQTQIPEDPQIWGPEDVEKFLKAKQEEFFLDDDDIEALGLLKNEISGRVFLNLTEKYLRADPFNVAFGAARSIMEIINKLKGEGKLPPLLQPISYIDNL